MQMALSKSLSAICIVRDFNAASASVEMADHAHGWRYQQCVSNMAYAWMLVVGTAKCASDRYVRAGLHCTAVANTVFRSAAAAQDDEQVTHLHNVCMDVHRPR
jgi:hypothetical protein